MAAASGMLPHEMLLAVARGEVVNGHVPTFAEQDKAMVDAAPYYASKLASTTVKVEGKLTLDMLVAASFALGGGSSG